MKRMIVTTVLLLTMLSGAALASNGFYINVTGATQGQFKGEATQQGHSNDQYGLAFSFGATAPTDRSTGKAPTRSKLQYSLLTITKAWGASSPQFFQALVKNETLTKVVLSFVELDQSGQEQIYYTITLTNARIASINAFKDLGTNSDFQDTKELESIGLSFERIDIEHKQGKTKATDTWIH